MADVLSSTEMNLERRIDLQSRISARGVAAGVLVLLATQMIFTMLGAGLHAFSFPHRPTLGLATLHSFSDGFWVWSCLTWIASAFVGGYVSSLTARSRSATDGALQGLVVWASVLALEGFVIYTAPFLMYGVGAGLMWGMLLADLAGLLTSMAGGLFAVRATTGERAPLTSRVKAPFTTQPQST